MMGLTILRALRAVCLMCAGLAGCAAPGAPLPEPLAGRGYFFPASTVVRVPGENNLLVYEYARLAGSDFPYAIEAAGRECRPEGKSAQLVSVGVKNPTRGWATFVCT